MINNFLCEKCTKASVCRIKDIIEKFSDDVKNPLGVTIRVEQCYNFDEDGDQD